MAHVLSLTCLHQRMVSRCFAIVLAICGCAVMAHGQEAGMPVSRFKVDAAGASVEITSPGGAISTEQALQAVEESARQLRARLAQEKKASDVPQPAPQRSGSITQASSQVLPSAEPLLSEPAPGDTELAWWDEYTFKMFPRTLFWQPPLANPWQPRMYAKLTSLKDVHTSQTIDTAIGGTLGLYRITPADNLNEGMQIDFFAVVLSRWSRSSHHVTSDYRFGIPLTFAWGNWQAKIAYEHTSSHLGDDYILTKGKFQNQNVHDEIALGLAYRFDEAWRVYGIYGVPVRAYNLLGTKAQHFDWGVEWSRRVSTSIYGQPFAAFDMEFREEQNWTANMTTQVGWQWLAMDTGRSLRLALEYFDGKSTFGQFFLDREQWYSVGVYVDF